MLVFAFASDPGGLFLSPRIFGETFRPESLPCLALACFTCSAPTRICKTKNAATSESRNQPDSQLHAAFSLTQGANFIFIAKQTLGTDGSQLLGTKKKWDETPGNSARRATSRSSAARLVELSDQGSKLMTKLWAKFQPPRVAVPKLSLPSLDISVC
ncbi:hypothetical protein PT974_04305 [Cladobotryum mycophilum]|uniref:Uncharacterized protein n=1 Tax=Cladobotryum mycophilum TaxID=491253 RepID=A0ABR0SUT5_9HYPO